MKKVILVTFILTVAISIGVTVYELLANNDIKKENEPQIKQSQKDTKNKIIEEKSNTPKEENLSVTQEEKTNIKENVKIEQNVNSKQDANIEQDTNLNQKNKEEIEKKGIYEGYADSIYIEINVDGAYDIYRISDQAKDALANKKIGESITFKYLKQGNENVITSVY